MPRLRRYAHSLASGYVLLAATTAFSLASVPLALRYLSAAEFGLWGVATSLAGYFALVDLGISGAAARLLVDFKDQRDQFEYGGALQTMALVGLVQGLLIATGGAVLSLMPPERFGIPPELVREFRWLVLGQCAVSGFSFATRIFGMVLVAQQRQAVANYAHAAMFGVNFAVQWAGFTAGWGVLSMLAGQASAALLMAPFTALICVRLGVLPSGGCWGRPSLARFREMFAFGKDVFLFALGSQLIHASQTLLITPLIGLEAAGLWTACTRAYTLISQAVWRVLDFSGPALAEMYVRGERDRLSRRFRETTSITACLALAGGVCFAVCNQPFVAVWTSGKFAWPPRNDWLLGVWLLVMAVQRCHTGLLGVRKELGVVKYIYFAEAAFFGLLTVLFLRQGGITAMIGFSVTTTLLFSFAFGHWRTKTEFGLTGREITGWYGPVGIIASWLLPSAMMLAWLVSGLRPALQLALTAPTLAGLCAWLLVRFGLNDSMKGELTAKAPRLVVATLRQLRMIG
jgi:O-antigen/teichoic acid export membrane protein